MPDSSQPFYFDGSGFIYSGVIPETLWPFKYPFGIAFSIGGLDIRWYAILSILGYLTAIVIFLVATKWRYNASVDPAFYYIFIGMPAILFGARFWSCLMGNSRWEEFFDIRTGGMAVQGGVVFGVIAALIYFPLILRLPKYHKRVVENGKVYIKKPSMWVYADAIIPTILLGQAIGRWGNFFNGGLFGHEITNPSDLYWLKSLFPSVYVHMQSMVNNPGIGLHFGSYYQPLFLYSSFAGILSFVILYLTLPLFKDVKIGSISGLYFVFYGISRFALESQRFSVFRFTGTFILNGILLAIGLSIFIYTQFIASRLRQYRMMKWILYLIKNQNQRVKPAVQKNNLKNQQAESTKALNWSSKMKINFEINVDVLKTKFLRSQADMYYYAGR